MERDRETVLRGAIDTYNRSSLAEFQLLSGLRYLDGGAPVYVAGAVRVRTFFVNGAGTHWCDAELVAESAYRKSPSLDYYRDQFANLPDAFDLWVVTLERGKHSACVAPVSDVCKLLDLDAPEAFPPGWARCWRTFPWESDAMASGLVAAGYSAIPSSLFEKRGG